MTTIAYPADPVVAGATEIQSTTFANVAADYTSLDWQGAQLLVARKVGQVFDYFPKSVTPDPNWRFYVRKDLTGAAAGQRNLIGIKVVSKTKGVGVFSGAQGANLVVPVTQIRVESYNWHLAVLTLTDNTSVPVVLCDFASYTLVQDPESEAILYGDGTHRSLDEAVGFLVVRTAANKPTNAPALNAITGLYPLG